MEQVNENGLLSEDVSSDSEYLSRKEEEIPIWKKPILTVVEAAKYFQIGEKTIRRITREYKDEDFVLWMDSAVFVRREPFEAFLNTKNEV